MKIKKWVTVCKETWQEIRIELKSRFKYYIAYIVCFIVILACYDFFRNQIIMAFSLGATGFILLIFPKDKLHENKKDNNDCGKTKKHFLDKGFLSSEKKICFYDIRNTLGGYIFGIVWGLIFGALLIILDFYNTIPLCYNIDFVKVFFATIATALNALFMTIKNSPHPPAAAFTLGLVMSVTEKTSFSIFCSFKSLFFSIGVVVISVIIMCGLRGLFDICDFKKQD